MYNIQFYITIGFEMTTDNTSSQTDASSEFFHKGKGDSNLSNNRLVLEVGSKDDIEDRKLIEQDNQSLSTPSLVVAKKVQIDELSFIPRHLTGYLLRSK
jgi:hypothetical protein